MIHLITRIHEPSSIKNLRLHPVLKRGAYVVKNDAGGVDLVLLGWEAGPLEIVARVEFTEAMMKKVKVKEPYFESPEFEIKSPELDFHPVEDLLAITIRGLPICIIDSSTGRVVRRLAEHIAAIDRYNFRQLVFSLTGRFLVTNSWSEEHLRFIDWRNEMIVAELDIETSKPLVRHPFHDQIATVENEQGGCLIRFLALNERDSSDIAFGCDPARIPMAEDDDCEMAKALGCEGWSPPMLSVSSMVFSNDGSMLALAGGFPGMIDSYTDIYLCVVEYPSLAIKLEIQLPFNYRNSLVGRAEASSMILPLRRFAFGADDRHLIVPDEGGRLCFMNVENGKTESLHDGHTHFIFHIEVQERHVITASWDNSLGFWELND